MRRRLTFSLLVALPPIALAAQRAAERDRSLMDDATFAPTSADVKTNMGQQGMNVAISPGTDAYPGVRFAPKPGAWDLSKFGHIDADVANSGPDPVAVSLRVDNAGPWQDNPWNTESVTLGPGEAKTIRVVFGYAYGLKRGYKLDPSKVVSVLFFTTKPEGPRAFRVRSLAAGGTAGEKPPVAPDDVRIAPTNGAMFDASLYTAKKVGLGGEDGAIVSGTAVAYPKTGAGVVHIRPSVGRWDLRAYTETRVSVRNVGSSPVSPRVRLESNGGASPWKGGPSLKPGETREIAVPFSHPIDLNDPEAPKGIVADAVGGVSLGVDGPVAGGALLAVEAVRAVDVPAKTPAWLGKRPPVAGDWTKTLDDEFDGTSLDGTVWRATGENYYDKVTHWSKGDVVVKGGLVRLRYEKKRGFQNDDPKREATNYAAGYLDTFGLWKQRYGYFEARMRVPRATGLWPAFWMMPDRGPKPGTPGWDRQSTADGGMEFDVMEGITRWGPRRYNVAMHYDGYGKDHKALGSDRVYVEPDKDGYVACGLLWTPGLAVYYCNGREAMRWKSPRVSNVASILMFTLPAGGWDNDPLDDALLPADFAIDYVRVWQRKDLASGADGKRRDP